MDNIQETSTLIAADKVQGTDVFNHGGDRLGSVHDLMIDKQTGQVAYAIMSFGGFLESETAIIRFPGRCCGTTRTSAAMSLRSIRGGSKMRHPIRSGPNRPGAIPNMRASFTTTMASALTGAFRDRFDAVPSSAPLGAQPA